MKERPILFSAPMVRAILDGWKTQTRRVVTPAPIYGDVDGMFASWMFKKRRGSGHWLYPNARSIVVSECPHGQPGDRLWVRETWQGPMWEEGTWDADTDYHVPKFCEYRADGGPTPEYVDFEDNLRQGWKPSIHMPRWASRITLEITGVRVERLQDISRGDAMAEGCPFPNIATSDDPRAWFCVLWRNINGDEAWDSSPWVWVIEFKRIAGEKS